MSDLRVTAEDVALKAGVSRSTVSRVFTPGRPVQAETRSRILKAAKELGYEPNALAQALISRRSHIVGILMGELSNPFHAVLHQSISHQLQSNGFIPVSAQLGPADDINRIIAMFRQYQVGVVVLTSMKVNAHMVAACQEAGLLVVLLNRVDEHGVTPSICADVTQGGHLAAERLADRGCKRIAVSRGAAGSWTSAARLKGHLEGLSKLGLEPLFVTEGGYTYEDGAKVADDIAASNLETPDGILCPNDLFAIGFMDRYRVRTGASFPDDLSVIGFDDIPMAAWESHALTTVRLPVSSMVERAVEMIDRTLMSQTPVEEKIWMPCRMVIRKSG